MCPQFLRQSFWERRLQMLSGFWLVSFGKNIRVEFTFFKKAAELLETFLGKNPLLAIIAVKFLYGTRIAMIVYVAARGMSFGTFALYNSIGTFLWLAVLFPLGYLTGKGLAQALPPIYAIQAAIVVLILSFIIMRMFSIWLTKRIGKKG